MVIKMYRKIFATIISFMLIFFCGCSKESKFGIEQFADRMNSQFEYDLNTGDFILGIDEKENNNLFYESENYLITLSLDNDNNIKGICLLFTDTQNTTEYIDLFSKMCSVFTENDLDSQNSILANCDITADKIKFADNNRVITVGKYKYTVVCNEYSVTLFCDRI